MPHKAAQAWLPNDETGDSKRGTAWRGSPPSPARRICASMVIVGRCSLTVGLGIVATAEGRAANARVEVWIREPQPEGRLDGG